MSRRCKKYQYGVGIKTMPVKLLEEAGKKNRSKALFLKKALINLLSSFGTRGADLLFGSPDKGSGR